MRLFVAVLPPASVLTELALATNRLRALPGADRLVWTEEQGWHLTLAFYGEVPDEQRAELDERLARAARRHPALWLRLSGGGRFGDRALWAGVAGDVRELGRLADSVAAAGRRVGVESKEDRRYRPHLTLARNRDTVELAAFAEALAPFEGSSWEAGELSLVRSELPAAGIPGAQPRYTVETAWPVGD